MICTLVYIQYIPFLKIANNCIHFPIYLYGPSFTDEGYSMQIESLKTVPKHEMGIPYHSRLS